MSAIEAGYDASGGIRKSSAATTTPLLARASLMMVSASRSLRFHAPPCTSISAGKGPLPRGLNTRARSGLLPCRRYSTSSTSISCVLNGMSVCLSQQFIDLVLDHSSFEKIRIHVSPKAYWIHEDEITKIPFTDYTFVDQFVGFLRDLAHIGHVPVADV